MGGAGFMAIQGKLWDERYYDRSEQLRSEAEEERTAWLELSITQNPRGEKQTGRSRFAFFFFLGLRDRRTRLFNWFTSFGLEDKVSGRTARLEADRLVGDPSLLDELEALYQQWRGLDSPDIRQFCVHFIPTRAHDKIDSPEEAQPEAVSPRPEAWTMPGSFYRREFFLCATQSDSEDPTGS